jgi:hypothetical protein
LATLQQLAEMYQRLERPSDEIRVWERIYELSPELIFGDSNILLQLEHRYGTSGRHAEQASLLQRALSRVDRPVSKLSPSDADHKRQLLASARSSSARVFASQHRGDSDLREGAQRVARGSDGAHRPGVAAMRKVIPIELKRRTLDDAAQAGARAERALALPVPARGAARQAREKPTTRTDCMARPFLSMPPTGPRLPPTSVLAIDASSGPRR